MIRSSGLPDGLLAAVACAVLLIGSFVLATAAIPMPPSERWAAIPTFSLLALAYTLQGSATLYDELGRIVRRDWRALAVLAALVPTLYLAYGQAVREFSWSNLVSTVAFVALPAYILNLGAKSRLPTLSDAVAFGYLWLALGLGLLPPLTLPQQGGVVGFFQLATPPLLLLLLAARGWPGLGFTWFLSTADLRAALLATTALLVTIGPLAWAVGLVGLPARLPGLLALLGAAVSAYFFVALPAEILLRGVAQNGLARVLDARKIPQAAQIGLAAGAILAALGAINTVPGGWRAALIAGLAAIGYGWVYARTGKVTASAVPHMFVTWLLALFAV